MDQITIGALTTCEDIRTLNQALSSVFSVNLGNRPADYPNGVLTTQMPLHREDLKSIGLDNLFSYLDWTGITIWDGFIWYEQFLIKAWQVGISATGRRFDAGPLITTIETQFPELRFSKRAERPISNKAVAGNIEVTVEDPYGFMKLVVSSSHC
jgi:hypothetical protein